MKKPPKKTTSRAAKFDPDTVDQARNSDAGLAPAADRALRILETFERIGEPLTLSRLAEEIDAPISSCHNLVRTLSSRGYLFSLDSQRTFYPTRKLLDIANSIFANDPVLQQILPHAQSLRDATSETVIVAKRQEFSALYLLTLDSPQNIRYVSEPGRRILLHSGATGKALLSTLDDDELTKWLGSRRLEQVTPKTITDHEKLRKDIRAGEARGYFTNSGENISDVSAIAVAFKLRREAFAIGVAGPTGRIHEERHAILRALKETVAVIDGIARGKPGLRLRK